ncbi:MAG: Wzz/FepE/Etk N-terminal domain-containing protein, partial [Pseudomonadota bacterium]
MSEKNVTLSEYGAILQRRKYHIAIPVILILLLSIVLAFTLPPVYRSTATILIEQPEIPDDLVSSTVTSYAAERIERIRSRIISSTYLLSLAKEFNLYPEIMDTGDEHEVINQIRENTGLEMVSAEAQDRSRRSTLPTIAFSVFYDYHSAKTAQQVTAKLAELYLAENRRIRTDKAHTTSVFLVDELHKLGVEISDMETRLANFKSQNTDYLPEVIARTREELRDAKQERNLISAAIETLEERRNFLNNQQAQFGLTGKLARAREELRASRAIYSDIHPDVISLKDTVETLEAEGSGSYANTSSEPGYLSLQSQLQETLGTLRKNRTQIRYLDSNIATYKTRLARAPEVERQYLVLTRDLDTDLVNYREIKDKVMEARLAEELEHKQKAERFALIDKANFPKSPIRPNRLGIILLGVMLALTSGIGVAAIAEYLDRRI